MSYIKLVRKHLILLNMHSKYMFVPLPKKLLPNNQKPEISFGLFQLGNNFLGKGTNV
jgi:hypothetical protein